MKPVGKLHGCLVFDWFAKVTILFTVAFLCSAFLKAQPNDALEFTRSSNEAVRADWSTPQNYQDWTWSMWVNPDNWNTNNRQSFISISEDQSNKPLNFDFGGSLGELEHYRGNAATKVMGYDVSTLSGWHHIALTQERTSGFNVNVKMYLDGVQVASASGNWEDMRTENIAIGASINPFNNNTESRHSDAVIDEIRIWTETRTQKQIEKYMHQVIPSPSDTPDLIGYYQLDDGTGTTTSDDANSSASPDQGGANNGTFVNTPSWVTSFAVLTDNNDLGETGNFSSDIDGIWQGNKTDTSGGLEISESSTSVYSTGDDLVFAHNGNFGKTESLICGVDSQFSREWLVDSDLGSKSADMKFITDLAGGGSVNSTNADEYVLIEYDGSDYSIFENNGNEVKADNVNASNNEVIFNDVELTSGNQYTLGIKETQPLSTITANDPICQGDTAQLQVNDAFQSYQWVPNNGLDNDTIIDPVAFPDSTTDYSVILTDSLGCKDTLTYQVNVKQDSMAPFPTLSRVTYQDSQNIEVFFDSISVGDFDGNYDLYRKKGNGSFSHVNSLDSTDYVDTFPSNNQDRYCYYLVANDTCGNSGYSDTHCVTYLTGNATNLGASLGWEIYKGFEIDEFIIERKKEAGWQIVDSISGSDSSYSDDSLNCNQGYDYRVKGLEKAGSRVTFSNVTQIIPFDTVRPSPPDIRNAGVVASDLVKLSFDTVADPDVNRYMVYASEGGNPFQAVDTLFNPGKGPITTYHSSIDPRGNRYCYKIFAVDSCSDLKSDSSEIHCPVQLSGDSLNLGNQLSWTPYQGYNVERYVIERYSAGNWVSYDTVSASDTSYADTGLACNKSYHYRIRTEEQGGFNSISYSDSLALIPYDTIDPKVPNIHYATVEGDSSTELSWMPSSGDVDRYVVYRDDAGGSFNAIDTVHGRLDTTYTDSLTTAISRSYCYRVKAIDSCANNESGLSLEHCTNYLTTNTNGCIQEINLDWNAYQGWDTVESYEIYRQKDSGSMGLLVTVDSATTSYTDTQVQFPHTYCYEIKAVQANGSYTSASNTSCDKPFEPNAPFVQSASKTVTDSINGTVKLTWNNQQGHPHLHYQKLYYQAPDSSGFSLLEDSIGLSQDSFVHIGLNTETANHRYYLTTVDSCGNESDSISIHRTMDLEFDVGQLLHELNWTPYEGWPVARYVVERWRNGQFNSIDTLSGTDTFQIRYPQPCNFPVSYRIKAVDSQGNYAYSDTGEREAIDTINPDPTTQRNVTILEDSVVEVSFTGADSLDIFSYDVMRKRGGGNYQLAERVIFDSAGGNFMVYDTTDTQIGQLFYTILTQDSCLNTVSSDTFCATYLEGEAQNLGNKLSWEQFEGYPVDSQFLLTYNGTDYDTLARLGSTDSNYTHGSLPCNVSQTYRVLNYEDGGNRETWSNPITLRPYDTVSPLEPAIRTISSDLNGTVNVEWEWDQTSDQKYFEVWRDNGNGIYAIQDTITYDSQYLDPGATPKQNPHGYFIRAIDSCAADGTIGAPGNRSIPSDTDRIMVPEVATGACQPGIQLNWTPYEDLPQGTDYYRIYRKDSNSSSFQQVTQTNDTAYTDTGIFNEVNYCYRIEAVDTQSGYSSYSDSVCIESFVYPDPQAAGMVRATVVETGINTGSIDLKWRRSPASDTFARGYRLYHRTANDTFVRLAEIPNPDDTTYRHQNINTEDSLHAYYVRIYNLCDVEGKPSDTHRAINLTLENHNLATGVHWTAYEGFDVSSYEIHRSVNGNPEAVIETLSAGNTSYIDSNIRCQQAYSYKIKAYDQSGNVVSWSDSQQVTGYDTLPPSGTKPHSASILQTGESNGIVEFIFNGSSEANRAGYYLYKAFGNGVFVPYDTIETGQINDTAYRDENLNTSDEVHRYYLRAFDSCGNVAVPTDTHSTIHLEATPRNHYNELDWTAYEGWSDYEYVVQRRQGNGNWQVIATVNEGTTTYEDSNVTCHKLYDYRILGQERGTVYEAYSNQDTARAFEDDAPAPPEIIRASVTAAGTNDGAVEITWHESISPDVEYYRLERSEDGASWHTLETLSSTIYRDSNLNTANEPYHYRLKAIDSCGNVSVGPGTVHKTIHLKAEGGNEEVNLNWTAYKGRTVDSYQVMKYGAPITTLSGNTTAYTDDEVVCDSVYEYKVRAFMGDTSVIIALSNHDEASPYDTRSPQEVYLQSVSVEQFNNVVRVEWEQSSSYDAAGYEIYRQPQPEAGMTLVGLVEGKERTVYYDTLNRDAGSLCYRVRVVDHCDNKSTPGNRGCVIEPKVESIEDAIRNELSWPVYQNWRGEGQRYTVYKETDNEVYQAIGTASQESREFTDDDLSDTVREFCYYVEAEGSGEDEASNSVMRCTSQEPVVYMANSFTPGITEGVNDKFGPKGVFIKNYTMKIFNRWGEKLYETTKGKGWDGRYEGQYVPQGVYTYVIQIEGYEGADQSYQGTLTVIR